MDIREVEVILFQGKADITCGELEMPHSDARSDVGTYENVTWSEA